MKKKRWKEVALVTSIVFVGAAVLAANWFNRAMKDLDDEFDRF